MVESRFFLVKTIVVKQIFHCDAYFTCIIEYTHFRNDDLEKCVYLILSKHIRKLIIL